METYYDGFFSDFDLYSKIDSSIINEDVQYDTSQSFSSFTSSENLLEEKWSDQSSVSSQHCEYGQTSFVPYRKTNPNKKVGSIKDGQNLQKRCFALLSKIHGKRGSTRQIAKPISTPKKTRSVERMIPERGRRIRLKQHFSNLHSLLPRNSKNNRNSILVNTISYLRALKLRVAELEQQCQILQAPISR